MHDLVVDRQLLAVVADHQHPYGAGALAESLPQLVPQVALVNDLQSLLDLTGLSHGNELAVVADVDEPVLLEDGAEERVEDDGWRWVRDDARLLMKLLGEQVNTEVPVLTSLSRGSDADDLAWAVLKDDQVTDADVMAWDGEGRRLDRVDRRDGGGLDLLQGLDGGGGRVSVFVVVAGHFCCCGRCNWNWDKSCG